MACQSFVLRHFVIAPMCSTKETDPILVTYQVTKPMLKTNTVELAVSDHPKCEDLVVAYGWSLMRINPEKRSRHVYFMEENLLHAAS